MPRFDLERVAEAARQGNVRLEGPRARDFLIGYLPTLVDCFRFAEEVAQGIEASDFFETLELTRDTADVYGLELGADILRRYGFDEDCRTWYAKITLQETTTSETLVFISLHALERPMNAYDPATGRGRKAGYLKPSW